MPISASVGKVFYGHSRHRPLLEVFVLELMNQAPIPFTRSTFTSDLATGSSALLCNAFPALDAFRGFFIECLGKCSRPAIIRQFSNDNDLVIPALRDFEQVIYHDVLAGFYPMTVNVYFATVDRFFGFCPSFEKPCCPEPFVNSYTHTVILSRVAVFLLQLLVDTCLMVFNRASNDVGVEELT